MLAGTELLEPVDLALQVRPFPFPSEALERALSKAEQEELADLLRFSSLGSIVGAAAEVARRLDLLATLRHVIYSPDVSDEMRELIEDVWPELVHKLPPKSTVARMVEDDVEHEAQTAL